MGKKTGILLAAQLLLIGATGLWGGDTPFALATALIGITFNCLVSANLAPGFLFGFVYAVCNGILAWQTDVYATFAFMIFMQAPMSLYSFAKWREKKKQTEAIMKRMSRPQLVRMLLGMAALFAAVFSVLSLLNGGAGMGVFFDTVFFVCSVTACIGLASCYKNAYIVNLASGTGGALLWAWKAATMGTGVSMAVFFAVVAVNSGLAVRQQYGGRTERLKKI